MRSTHLSVVAGFIAVVALGSLTVRAQAPATPDRIAEVDGKPILAADVDAKLGASLAKLEEQIYNLRRAQLDALIDQELLEREAAKRGITLTALVDAEITSRVPATTTAEASAFFEANKAKLPAGSEFTALQEQIKTYLDTQRAAARRQELVKSLRDRAAVNVFLAPPPVFRVDVPIAAAPVRGVATAPVTIVEFSDFHCPFCRRAQPVLTQLLAKYGQRVRLVFKDFPLDNLHPNAREASEAAACAGDQGKFWEFHDKVFASDPDVTPATMHRFATEVGLNLAVFDACRTSGKFKAQIEASGQDGTRLGVTGTPTFFINGRNLTGAQPFEAFARVIDEELSKPPSPTTTSK